MLSFFKKFVREDEGATMVEYGLMVALIAIAIIAAVAAMSGSLKQMYTDVGGNL